MKPTYLSIAIMLSLLTILLATVRSWVSLGEKYVPGCKDCKVCGEKIRGLCVEKHEHDWCECLWRVD